jgi:hypothetical protein
MTVQSMTPLHWMARTPPPLATRLAALQLGNARRATVNVSNAGSASVHLSLPMQSTAAMQSAAAATASALQQ